MPIKTIKKNIKKSRKSVRKSRKSKNKLIGGSRNGNPNNETVYNDAVYNGAKPQPATIVMPRTNNGSMNHILYNTSPGAPYHRLPPKRPSKKNA